MQSLTFFNKEGDNLNFRWNTTNERWEGDLIFHENSNDTFKTIGIYTFEKIPSFEFELPGTLNTRKFQLFNEFRFQFTGNSFMTQSVSMIELTNTNPDFFSKWIYGDHFESKFPVGSEIKFNNSIFEFNNTNQSFTVVATKKGAIMILSNIDNNSFNSVYGTILGLTQSYQNVTISGVNSIGVWNYVNETLENNLSAWSEPDFYSKYFNGKKLTVLNTNSNNGVKTVNNVDLFDKIFWKWELPAISVSDNIIAELTLKTDVPVIYTGALNISTNTISFSGIVPEILKPGTEFTIPLSTLNTNAIVVDSIPTFLGNSNLTYYATQSQVIWENRIYECLQAYTWSGTSSITPASASYWGLSNYIPTTSTLVPERFASTEVHLTTNKILFQQTFTSSGEITLASFSEKWKDDFKFYNVDLYYEENKLNFDLIYPSPYAELNVWTYSVDGFYGTNSIASKKSIYQQNVGVSEILTPEISENTNENFNYNIVFTDLDEFGLKIIINGHIYQEEIDFIYSGLNVNMDRTIDRTLRNWLSRNYSRLLSLGIICRLEHVGPGNSIYFNTINLKTEYPNVPLQFFVEVGTTADFYIEHSQIIFYDMSNYLLININGRDYGQSVTLTNGVPDISTALQNWVDEYSNELDDYKIYVQNINSMLIFKVKDQNQRLEYKINTGKITLPGIDQLKIIRKLQGKFGATITSNEIILNTGTTYSFEDYPFATGQIVSINNTNRPLVNQEYNILYLGPENLVLSYQGPFWSDSTICDVSPYTIIAFNGGFGATGCVPVTPPLITYRGQFKYEQFTYSFNIFSTTSNNYKLTTISLGDNTNPVDIIYVQLTDSLYVLGDKISVLDANDLSVILNITLPGIGTPISIKFNSYNSYIYCLGTSKLFIFDPITNTLVSASTLTNTPHALEINTTNGDVYVSYSDSQTLSIWYPGNLSSNPSQTISGFSGNTLSLAYNEDEDNLYIIQDDGYVISFDGGSRSLNNTYFLSGLIDFIYYEPTNSSIYVFDSSNLININSGLTQSIGINTESFNDLVFNNLSGNIEISGSTKNTRIDLSGNIISTNLTNNYGSLSVSQYDGDIYMSSQTSNQIIVLDSSTINIKYVGSLPGKSKKTIFDPSRRSMVGIVPSANILFESSVILGTASNQSGGTYSNLYDNNYGTLHPDYVPHPDIWLKTREYLRRPRENYNQEGYVQYVWKWETDEYPEMFLYDFSGTQLDYLVSDGAISPSYSYVGEKPLSIVTLNRNPNKDVTKTSYPEFQQTIFDEIKEQLDHVDSETDLSFVPEPMETFIGFRSQNEGPMNSTLLLLKREDISFTITTTSINSDILTFKLIVDSVNGNYGTIALDVNSQSVFTFDSNDNVRGLKPGQLIKVNISDVTNNRNKYSSSNQGKVFKIRSVYTRILVVDFVDEIVNETTQISDYPTTGKTTYLSCKISVIDREIGRFNIYGQTEIEDIRYKIELSNVGQNIEPSDVFIFKPYDINEQGVDWTYLNKKRKEMLMVRHDIFPYVGSYKAIINSINYFGYNDLELYEYYRNINVDSPDFFKLFKVEIPDIFDNSVEGWTTNDFIKHTMPNPNFEDTNLFNLTYKITDKEGNNVLMYSLSEVILKLQGLKYWLQRKVIPITHRILDITGRADFVGEDVIVHRNYDVKIINIKESMTPIDFKLNEAYLMPVNSGSTVYTCHIDFYYATSSIPPDYFTIDIRTYKTYKEWNPFTVYNMGDEVTYYGKVYQSVLENNKLKNPKKYDTAPKWNNTTDYTLGQIVNYQNLIYQYIGTQSSFIALGTSSVPTPYYDIITNYSFASWIDITEWKNMDFVPVQKISEFRTGTQSFNFTIDSNIDPFVVIEVTTDNGYGGIYTSKKNYEIRGLNDLFVGYVGDKIGPFEPIVQITSPVIPKTSPPVIPPIITTV